MSLPEKHKLGRQKFKVFVTYTFDKVIRFSVFFFLLFFFNMITFAS